MLDSYGAIVRCPDIECGNAMTLDLAVDACPQCHAPLKSKMEALRAVILSKNRTETSGEVRDAITDTGRDIDAEKLTNSRLVDLLTYQERRLDEERKRRNAIKQASLDRSRRRLL